MEVWKIFSILNGRFVSSSRYIINLPECILNPDSLGRCLRHFTKQFGPKEALGWFPNWRGPFSCATPVAWLKAAKMSVGSRWNMVELNPGANGRVNALGLDFNSCVCVSLRI